MQPVFFVMAILGCGDDSTACVQQRVEPAHYATAAQCRAAMPAALLHHTDLEFPVISAACQRIGNQVADRGVRARG